MNPQSFSKTANRKSAVPAYGSFGQKAFRLRPHNTRSRSKRPYNPVRSTTAGSCRHHRGGEGMVRNASPRSDVHRSGASRRAERSSVSTRNFNQPSGRLKEAKARRYRGVRLGPAATLMNDGQWTMNNSIGIHKRKVVFRSLALRYDRGESDGDATEEKQEVR